MAKLAESGLIKWYRKNKIKGNLKARVKLYDKYLRKKYESSYHDYYAIILY